MFCNPRIFDYYLVIFEKRAFQLTSLNVFFAKFFDWEAIVVMQHSHLAVRPFVHHYYDHKMFRITSIKLHMQVHHDYDLWFSFDSSTFSLYHKYTQHFFKVSEIYNTHVFLW